MALSAALHHSRGVGPELHEAPRGPKTDRAVEEEVREVNDALEGQKRPPPGVRPAPLSEVAGPQAAVTVGYVAAGVPLLGAPSMASPSAEAIDESTLSFLLAENLARVKEKEEVEELVADLDRKEQKLLEELVRYRASFKRGDRGSRVGLWPRLPWQRGGPPPAQGGIQILGQRVPSSLILVVPQFQVTDRLRDDCAALRGSGARVFVCEYADMGYDCAALRGSGARVSVCGYADMGKACAFVFLGLVLEFTAVQLS